MTSRTFHPLPVWLSSVAILLGSNTASGQPWQVDYAIGLGDVGPDEGRAVAVDTSGNAYVVGHFQGTVDFDPLGGTALSSAGGSDIFVAKYSSSGSFVWAQKLGGSGDDLGHEITLANDGNVWVTGTSGSDDGSFDGQNHGGTDMAVALLSGSTGAVSWAKLVGRFGG